MGDVGSTNVRYDNGRIIEIKKIAEYVPRNQDGWIDGGMRKWAQKFVWWKICVILQSGLVLSFLDTRSVWAESCYEFELEGRRNWCMPNSKWPDGVKKACDAWSLERGAARGGAWIESGGESLCTVQMMAWKCEVWPRIPSTPNNDAVEINVAATAITWSRRRTLRRHANLMRFYTFPNTAKCWNDTTRLSNISIFFLFAVLSKTCKYSEDHKFISTKI